MKLVYAANTSTVVNHATGLKIRLVANEPWSADDPFVKLRPELFTETPMRVRRTVERAVERPIETATRAPGEKRAKNGDR